MEAGMMLCGHLAATSIAFHQEERKKKLLEWGQGSEGQKGQGELMRPGIKGP